MKKFKKSVLLLTTLALIVGMFAGCGKVNKQSDDKVDITVAAWPVKESNQAKYEMYENYKAKFLEENPNVNFNTDEWRFDLKSYLVRAVGKDLPTVFTTAPTELATLVNSGYIKDITPFMEKYGYLDKYDETQSHIYMYDDKCYALVDPGSVYTMGMVYSNKLMKIAGLVDEDGSIIYPKTWDEVTEAAIKIKDATGKPGYVINSTNRMGGWHLLNMAYGNGVDFVKNVEGKWKATFNTPEFVETLQWVKDMKWKHNVLQDNLLSDAEIGKLVGTDAGGMGIAASNHILAYPKSYGTDPNAVSMSSMPGGKKGKVALSSANIWVFDANATDEEVEAVFKWFDMIGLGPNVTDEVKVTWDEDYKIKAIDQIVGIPPASIWKDETIYNERYAIMKKYSNVDENNYTDYIESKGVTFRFDPEKCAQELYDILDSAIQRVLTDKNADVKQIVEEAAYNFQVNFLDKAE